MGLYMTQFSYTPEAWAALVRNPTDRKEGLATLMRNTGGRLIELYYCFGDYDGVALFEAPDETTAVGVLLAVIAPGHVKTIKTTVLMTVPQTVEAMRKASGQSYSAPR